MPSITPRSFRHLLPFALFSALTTSAGAQTTAALRSGELVYQKTCVACHTSGATGAPKLGDAAKWKPLIAEGQYVLTAHAFVGVRGMPARGGDPSLGLEEFSRAVAYMGRSAGASWQDPDPALLMKIQAEAEKRQRSLKSKQPPGN